MILQIVPQNLQVSDSNRCSHSTLFFQLEFIGIRGSGIRSDIAIDAITTYDGECSGMEISFSLTTVEPLYSVHAS